MKTQSLVVFCSLIGGSRAGGPAFTWTLPANASIDEQALALTAQGLLNERAPVVWFIEPVFWTYAPATQWFVDNYLEPKKGFTFTDIAGDFCSLAAATGILSSTVKGVALYDGAALDATRWLAVTTAALQGLLPVTRALVASHACLASLPVVVDYSQPAARGWSSNLAAYAWAKASLLPQCSASALFSAGHSYADATESVNLGVDPAIDIGLDGAVARKMFVFNLSPDTVKYPAHAAAFTDLVATLVAATPGIVPSLYGWAEPEPDMTMAVSKAGGSVLCDGAPNLSFWYGVASSQPALPYNVRGVPLQREHVYIAWQTNEGDTIKIAGGLQGGLWVDPARGSVPMAWGIDPLLLDVAPGLLEFYAATATANDSFFSATAGAGYVYPSRMPPASFAAYVNRTAAYARALTPGWPPYSWEVDIWDTNNASAVSAYAAIAGDAVGMFSMQPEALAGTNAVLPGGLPLVITALDLWYPFSKTGCPPPGVDPVDTLAAIVVNATAGITTRPAFLLVYGVTYDPCSNRSMFEFAAGVQARLGAGGAPAWMPPLSVVGMQDLVALARQAAAGGAAEL